MTHQDVVGLEVSLHIGCPNMCQQCPQNILLKAYKGPRSFTLENYKKCISSVPLTKQIQFMGFSELWTCKDAREIILYTHNKGHKIGISTTLRGATHEDIEAIKDIPFTDMVLHTPPADGSMNLEPTPEWLELFEHAIRVLRYTPGFVISVFGPPHPKVLPIWKHSGIPLVNFTYHDRAGYLDNLPHKRRDKMVPCGKSFSGNLLPNGDITLCCNSWNLEPTFGNLFTQTYEEIYRSQKFVDFMKECGKEDYNGICRWCADPYMQVNQEDRHKSFENPI